MKRIFALCLVLALLAGCAPAPSAPSSGAPASSQTVQEPPAPTFAVGVLDTVQWSGYGTGSNGGDAYYELAVLAENAAGPGRPYPARIHAFAYGLRYADAGAAVQRAGLRPQ